MPGLDVEISYPLAFLAGLVSFLSPCVLPIVPSYLAFVSGLTLGELRDEPTAQIRRTAALHSILFVVGFSAVFMTLGLVATTAGLAISAALPWLTRLGGAVLVVFGLVVAGVIQIPALARERRVELSSRPAGVLGSVAVGVAFGAGWTPCIGPILGSILLYAGLETTMLQGTTLLGTYALGLGVPFVATSVGLNWFLAGSSWARRWLTPIQRIAGTVLVLIGVLMVTGHFASLTAFLAGMGQLINLEVQ
ncbi:MAG: cytochrome c biogenesis protein CcdA [Gemmatimonadetes bacterium]|nr:cytochrome c biogenesis protein CcdA [Gemmatimonadota bacterium]NNF12480.1 cytochrome c biogenesis protein CcdA [Gemmatimonadota bacterium]